MLENRAKNEREKCVVMKLCLTKKVATKKWDEQVIKFHFRFLKLINFLLKKKLAWPYQRNI